MESYDVRGVAGLLGLPLGRVRTLTRAAGLPEDGLDFRDLVVLRALAGLVAARISPQRVRRAVGRLKSEARPLAGVALAAQGRSIVARDEGGLEDVESGQRCLDFSPPRRSADEAHTPLRRPVVAQGPSVESAEDCYLRGLALEQTGEAAAAAGAYLATLELDPSHADAHVNLGRLCHEAQELEAAEKHYRSALAVRPLDPVARFNLGVVLDDLGRVAEAITAYRAALVADPASADAHFNLARLLERDGDRLAALRHLSRYRQLTRGR
jgi:tetratricopeptide (TPR) repeat protein